MKLNDLLENRMGKLCRVMNKLLTINELFSNNGITTPTNLKHDRRKDLYNLIYFSF